MSTNKDAILNSLIWYQNHDLSLILTLLLSIKKITNYCASQLLSTGYCSSRLQIMITRRSLLMPPITVIIFPVIVIDTSCHRQIELVFIRLSPTGVDSNNVDGWSLISTRTNDNLNNFVIFRYWACLYFLFTIPREDLMFMWLDLERGSEVFGIWIIFLGEFITLWLFMFVKSDLL